jgi:hypothetical protein
MALHNATIHASQYYIHFTMFGLTILTQLNNRLIRLKYCKTALVVYVQQMSR